MSAKQRVQEYAENAEGAFTSATVAEELGLNISTVRKAIADLVEEKVLVRGDNNAIEKKKKITRVHTKPKIKDLLAPKFRAALEGVNIVIPPDATADEKREQKATIKAALSTVTYGNTVAEIAACKDFSKYSESHLTWYKSQYLREQRAVLAAANADQTVEADQPLADVG